MSAISLTLHSDTTCTPVSMQIFQLDFLVLSVHGLMLYDAAQMHRVCALELESSS